MDARTRTLLEAIAFGEADDLRPADRLRAVEMLADVGEGEAGVVAMVRMVRGMSEAELAADVDQMTAAHVIDAWTCPDRWPITRQVIDRVLREARVSRETPAPHEPTEASLVRSDHAEGWGVNAAPVREPLGPAEREAARRGSDPVGVDPALGGDVGWRPFA